MRAAKSKDIWLPLTATCLSAMEPQLYLLHQGKAQVQPLDHLRKSIAVVSGNLGRLGWGSYGMHLAVELVARESQHGQAPFVVPTGS